MNASVTMPSAVTNVQTLDQILQRRDVTTLLQPIVHRGRGEIWGFEALSRGPSASPFHAPMALFDQARKEQRLWDTELVCVQRALTHFTQQRLPGRLFLNLSYESLIAGPRLNGQVVEYLRALGLRPEQVVIELTEHTPTTDMPGLRRAVSHFQDYGFAIALDDLGAGYASLRLWSEIKPDYVKIDRHFVSGIDLDGVKMEFVRSIIEIARSLNCAVIAEGVETLGEMEIISGMGVELMQGYLFARPAHHPHLEDALRLCQEGKAPARDAGHTALQLISSTESVAPDVHIMHVAKRFHDRAALNAIAVVEDGRPIGLVQRNLLLAMLSKPFALDLYAHKPIRTVMSRDPLRVDAGLRLEQVSRMVTARARLRMEEDFIITREGRFAGMGQVIDLLRQITEVQVKTARHANPLTMLPGNIPINDCIDRLLSERQAFTMAYIDLDHFKPFNDLYGYAKGDAVLLLLADLLRKHIHRAADFVGHIGGDDFVAVFTDADWVPQLQAIADEFRARLRGLYLPEHVAAGGFCVEDRYGEQRVFPLISLSISAVVVAPGQFASAPDIAARMGKLKHMAKHQAGDVLVILERDETRVQRLG